MFHAAMLPSCKLAKPCRTPCRHCRLTGAAAAQAIHLQDASLEPSAQTIRRVAVPRVLAVSEPTPAPSVAYEGRFIAARLAVVHLCDKPCCLGSSFARRSDAFAGCCRLVGGLQFGCGGCKASRFTSATSGNMPARKRTSGHVRQFPPLPPRGQLCQSARCWASEHQCSIFQESYILRVVR